MKKLTLVDFIKLKGSQEAAARALEMPLITVNRWFRGESEPSPMAVKMLKSHGIEWKS